MFKHHVASKVDEGKIVRALSNWSNFIKLLKSMNENELKRALEIESDGPNRFSFVGRLYGAYSVKRATRERKELKLTPVGKRKSAKSVTESNKK